MKSRPTSAMIVAAAVVALALAAAPSQAWSRPILFFQKRLSIYKVRLTPRHRPTRVVGTKAEPLAITVAPGQVFWTTSETSRGTEFKNAIMAATVRGKDVHKVASGLPITIDIVAADGYLYWPDEDGIGRVAFDGSHLNHDFIPLPEEYGGGVADGITVAGRYLFFSRCQDDSVGRVDLTDRSVEQDLIHLPGRLCPQSMAAAGGRVFWTELGGFHPYDGRVGSANINGTHVDQSAFVLDSPDGPFGLAAAGNSIFWSYGGSAGSPQYVSRAKLSGGLLSSKFVSGGSALALLAGS
ncbi:MAG TPA: hypothetical protein VMH33_07470 [Solirubrobacterales bacterium]|nr:hypothetical protein [Solirubrobacterales bacterium]